jgi:hypothetical protein
VRNRWPRGALLTLTLLGLAWLGWWILAPDFIELDVPMPLHRSGVMEVWDEESRARVRYTGSGSAGCDYVLRRRGVVDPSRYEWKSQQQIVDHFHRWLTARGWVLRGGSPSFNPALPEGDVLGDGHPGVRSYSCNGDQWGREGIVIVAVWPWTPADPSTWYHVVLASKRPSFVRLLLVSFD